MNEADIRLEVYHSLQGYGYWPLHGRDAIICPRCGAKVLPQVAGRPDLLVLSPMDTMAVMEVKAVNLEKALSFAFSQIDDDQRRWLNAWTDHLGWAYLALGTLGEKPRRLWVIFWDTWRATEANLVAEGFTNMPIDLALYKHVSKAVPTISVSGAFTSEYGMHWITSTPVKGEKFTGSHWEFPEYHQLSRERKNLWKI